MKILEKPEVFARVVAVEKYKELSEKLLEAFHNRRIFALHGPMGVGKTTLIKYLCNSLGVSGIVSSPTFSIVNEYSINNHKVIYHFDFYRIKKIEEVYDLGYEEYLYSGNYCFIEWPEKLGALLPDDCVRIFMEDVGGERVIRVES
jgi:tRNA threonylcarbamoyladenosine biosynthesis protein TsaE